MKAQWKGQIIAESNETIVIENNHYFPPDSVKKEFLEKSNTHTRCPWKGEASYYHIKVDGQKNADAAWYYPETSELAKQIKGFVAFWKGVEITE